jgi:(1->4)-alpha-D-glucan 1-alpha-D-glucosylmutase
MFGPQSRYEPLRATGPHLIGYSRGDAITLVTRWPGRLAASGGWGEAVVVVP